MSEFDWADALGGHPRTCPGCRALFGPESLHDGRCGPCRGQISRAAMRDGL